MNDCSIVEHELICIIVNSGLGSKAIRIAKKHGITGGTVFLARGTAGNRLLELLTLADSRKEVVVIIAKKSSSASALAELEKKFEFSKPNHGIAFTSTVFGVRGIYSGDTDNTEISKDGSGERIMFNSIFAIVDKGRAEDVIDAAVKAGAKGGTIINGRGSGTHEISKVFAMEIEPEREIVLILAEDARTEQIAESINRELEMEKPGGGILFIHKVDKTYGVHV